MSQTNEERIEELAKEVRLFVNKREFGEKTPFTFMDILNDFVKEKEREGIKIDESELKIAIMLSVGIDLRGETPEL